MFLKSFPFLILGFWGVIVILPYQANAATPLTRAEIQNLKNLVQLLPKNNKQRPARRLDPMIPGDGLSTGRLSLADLRFNDGSLARVGERALFQFLPKTRNFMLSNGTLLLLIPPGRGQTRIQTPSAAAAIRGSALFVRYDQQTDTTIVGALTNSGIEVFNREASQNQVLAAGQLMVIVKGQFQGLYDFDLRSFYETSDLVKGLNLTKQNLTPNPDPAIASVQAEIAVALAAQSPVVGQGVIENPSFLELSATSSSSPNQSIAPGNSPINSLVETGQFLSDTIRPPSNNDNTNTVNPEQPIGVNNPENPIGGGNSGNPPGGTPENPIGGGNSGNPPGEHMGGGNSGNPPGEHMGGGNSGNPPGEHMGGGNSGNPPGEHMGGGNSGNPPGEHMGGGNSGNPPGEHMGGGNSGTPPGEHMGGGNSGNPPGGTPENPMGGGNSGNPPGGTPENPVGGGNSGTPDDNPKENKYPLP